MIEKNTVARPYARAAFGIARAAGNVAAWSQGLAAFAAAMTDPAVQTLVSSPRVPKSPLGEAFGDLAGPALGEPGRNFLYLLAENRRLGLLPEIAQLFEEMRAEAERAVEATVISATPLGAAQQKAIAQALKKRLDREVTLKCETDPRIIGGAVIRAGDLVIDGSVRSKLERLATALTR
jgi:F-type H+-transporting ATPase subunit delta